MTGKKIIVANWKMHKTRGEAKAFIEALLPLPPEASVWIAPPFTALASGVEAARGAGIQVGAQNMHPEARGAYTGEVSAPMLLECGATFVILGHSERRKLFGETDTFINAKIHTALTHKLTPILCIGESLQEREEGRVEEVLTHQLFSALQGVPPAPLLIAYEPVWAIGMGKSATLQEAREAHALIRRQLATLWGKERAEKTPILYGGSVSVENAPYLLREKGIDGALIGGASLDPTTFKQIIEGVNT